MKRSGLICGILEGWESIGLGDCSDKAAEKGKIVVKNDSSLPNTPPTPKPPHPHLVKKE